MTIKKPSSATIQQAASILATGGVVAFPTETVYGLGANAKNDASVVKIFETKTRPQTNPLIIHVADLSLAKQFAKFPTSAAALAQHFWPGPLTLVLERVENSGLSEKIYAGNTTVAIRIPAHPLALSLLQNFSGPVAAPSANRSGHVSPTTADHVANDLGDQVDMILDGGPTTKGIESTIVQVFDDHVELLRPGSITSAEIATALDKEGVLIDVRTNNKTTSRPNAPGQLESHYAPRATVRLNADAVAPGEALLAFGSIPKAHTAAAAHIINLSPTGNIEEAASLLFAALRELDAKGTPNIAVMPIPKSGVGLAINDRLARAAVPR